ncbi:MAG: hypothetical protein Fur0043_04060 [Anaerolineales bacterium]
MPVTPVSLVERLKAEGEKCLTFFEALAPAQWQVEVYEEGGVWTVRSVLAHFVTAERGFLALFQNILAGGEGATEDFSIDRYNARQQEKTRDMSPAALLEEFRAVRTEMVAWVADLTEADLCKEGRHPFLGQTTLAEMIKMVYLHNQIHLRDLRKCVA